eukprot:CAMPEP_0117641176 /NCGR_PEP_ID=MMETSP0802-20121206/9218_1 /TAXON_ID=38833 /ORGANISM="Micromonas sp., Strain CCMP2099" /LENGTH=72 /DNA_ID=CAMNT_0005446153 /DNA_START=596 /DNA_END=814 /DNA_ORIENTATION=+
MGSSSAAWNTCSSVAWNSAEPTPTTASIIHAQNHRLSHRSACRAWYSPRNATPVIGTDDAVFHASAIQGEYT